MSGPSALRLGSTFRVLEVPRGRPGPVREVWRRKNSVLTSGVEMYLDLMAGLTTPELDATNAAIEVVDGAGAELFSQIGPNNGYPDLSTQKQAVFQWTDDRASTSYTVDRVRLRQGDAGAGTLGTIFSETSAPFADNAKPTTHDWIYEYLLSVEGVETTFQNAGLHSTLEAVTGVASGDYDATNTRLRVLDSGGVELGFETPDSVSRTNQTMTWEFVVPAGNLTGEWHTIEIRGAWAGAPSGGYLLRSEAEQLIEKRSSTKRTYRYKLTA